MAKLFAAARQHCLALPEATERVNWGNVLVFRIGERMFAMFGVDARGAPARLSFLAGQERFLELTDQPAFAPAPYMARQHWVALTEARTVSAQTLAALLDDAYRLAVTKLTQRAQRELAAAHPEFAYLPVRSARAAGVP